MKKKSKKVVYTFPIDKNLVNLLERFKETVLNDLPEQSGTLWAEVSSQLLPWEYRNLTDGWSNYNQSYEEDIFVDCVENIIDRASTGIYSFSMKD